MVCRTRCSARPNCIDSLGASGIVSLTPEKLYSTISLGRQSVWGTTTPRGETLSSTSTLTCSYGRTAQYPWQLKSRISSNTNSSSSYADLCGTHLAAALHVAGPHGRDEVSILAPRFRKCSNTLATLCGSSRTFWDWFYSSRA